MKNLNEIITRIKPLDTKSMEAVKLHHADLLMPAGALDVPLSYVEQLAGIRKTSDINPLTKKRVVLFASDHGIASEGVSAYPQEVTAQMLGSFANSWAVITSLAKSQKLDVVVVDVGVKGEAVPGIVNKKIASGTKNFLKEDAMSKDELEKALEIGMTMAKETKDAGYDMALLGEMGIGNTTSASAITSALLDLSPALVTGRGTGVDDAAYQKKIAVIQKALQARSIQKDDAVRVLQKVGGFEIVAMTGFLLAAAAYRLPVMLDGFITGAAALSAYSLEGVSKQYWIAGHVSKEIGHRKILEHIGIRPMLDLDLRLGEASGAAFALPLLEQAIAVSLYTGTFTQANVSNKK